MAEWLKAPVLKTGESVMNGRLSSNLSSSSGVMVNGLKSADCKSVATRLSEFESLRSNLMQAWCNGSHVGLKIQ